MLVIRLARTGRAKYPTYRIVAAESSRPATGRFVEILGHYNPHTKVLVIKHEETKKRMSQGAQPSNTVVKLLTRDKVELPDWVKLKTKTRKVEASPATEEVSAAEAAADADASVVAELPSKPSDAPALTDDIVVATVASDAATDASDDVANINDTETESSDAKVQEDAEAASDAGADAAEAKSAAK